MRLFIGIPLAPPVIGQLSAISVRLQSNRDGLRWSPPESWHITLQFLGNTSPEQYECIVARLRGLRSPPVPVKFEGLSFFDRAGIFYAGVDLTPELLSLQQAVTARTGFCGYLPETRPYHPHITLARSKDKAGAEGFRQLRAKIRRQPSFTGFVADMFLLYESFTRATGAHYEIRERFCLNGGCGHVAACEIK